jgi:hypothetical protein
MITSCISTRRGVPRIKPSLQKGQLRATCVDTPAFQPSRLEAESFKRRDRFRELGGLVVLVLW